MDLSFVVPALTTVGALVGLFVKGQRLKKIVASIKQIQEVVTYYRQAMADGKLSDEEKDGIIEEIADVVQVWV